MERIIGDYGDKNSSTLIFCIGGIHGNEIGGVIALEKVFEVLEREKPPFNGRFIGIRGNIQAIQQNVRCIEEDLNRLWSDEFVHIAQNHESSVAEFHELAEIYQFLTSLDLDHYHNKIFLDLHSTSAENGIFAIVGEDAEDAMSIVQHLHTPVVLGLHKSLHNTTVPYMSEHGFTSFAFEGGKIATTETMKNHVKILWQTLRYTGCIHPDNIPEEVLDYSDLDEFRSQFPDNLQVNYCHKIQEGDNFVMEAGFKNFDRIKVGDLLAKDKHGEIRSQHNGYMLMPLYQATGKDGFFIISKAQ